MTSHAVGRSKTVYPVPIGAGWMEPTRLNGTNADAGSFFVRILLWTFGIGGIEDRLRRAFERTRGAVVSGGDLADFGRED